jgi:hypothetical protein
MIFILGKLHFTLLKYSPICTFASKVLNVTLYPPPPQTFKLWQFDHFDLFFPKMPLSHILFFFNKNPKKKKRKEICWGGSATQHISFFFSKKNKKCDGGILEKKKVKVVELPQFESLSGGKVSHLKLWRQKCKSVDTSGGKSVISPIYRVAWMVRET